jgi:hypothetical protein
VNNDAAALLGALSGHEGIRRVKVLYDLDLKSAEAIAKLHGLRSLTLGGFAFAVDAARALTKLRNLEELELFTASAEACAELARIESLKRVKMWTIQGLTTLEKLRAALPGCTFDVANVREG